MKFTFSLCIAVLLVAICQPFLFGQGESDTAVETPKETPDVVAAKKSLGKFAELLKGAKWDELKGQMSEKGQNSLVTEICYALAVGQEIEMGGEGQLPPGLKKIAKKIDTVKDKYELDNVAELLFEGNSKEAVALLEASGKKWEIADAVWKAQSGSPFHMHPAIGAIDSFEIDGDTIYLNVKMEPISSAANDDSEIMIEGAPQVVRMKKTDGNWKYDGVDEERTMANMEKFMAEFDMGGMGEFGGMEPPKILDDPSFSGKTFDGSEIKLDDYKGKIIVLDFWGTWCAPCVAAMPSLKLIREAFKEHGVEIIGIASDDKKSVETFCKKNEIPWPNLVDANGDLANKFGVRAFPTMMVIGKDGKHLHSDIEKKPLVDELIKQLGLDEKDFSDLKAKLKKASNEERPFSEIESGEPKAKF